MCRGRTLVNVVRGTYVNVVGENLCQCGERKYWSSSGEEHLSMLLDGTLVNVVGKTMVNVVGENIVNVVREKTLENLGQSSRGEH